jgi:hypothetical protein
VTEKVDQIVGVEIIVKGYSLIKLPKSRPNKSGKFNLIRSIVFETELSILPWNHEEVDRIISHLDFLLISS